LSSCAATEINFHGLADDVLLSANNSVLTSDLKYGEVYYVESSRSSAEGEVRKIVEISESLKMPVVFFFNEGYYYKNDCGDGSDEGVRYDNCAANASAFNTSLKSDSIKKSLASIKAIFVRIDNVLMTYDVDSSVSLPTAAELTAKREQQISDFSRKTYTTVPACLKYLATEVKPLAS